MAADEISRSRSDELLNVSFSTLQFHRGHNGLNRRTYKRDASSTVELHSG
eukprot:m.24789 g.24789  ORF g.24789 m.24789 type:complete len:50 (+) comp13108_c0_seq3:772-921(+)